MCGCSDRRGDTNIFDKCNLIIIVQLLFFVTAALQTIAMLWTVWEKNKHGAHLEFREDCWVVQCSLDWIEQRWWRDRESAKSLTQQKSLWGAARRDLHRVSGSSCRSEKIYDWSHLPKHHACPAGCGLVSVRGLMRVKLIMRPHRRSGNQMAPFIPWRSSRPHWYLCLSCDALFSLLIRPVKSPQLQLLSAGKREKEGKRTLLSPVWNAHCGSWEALSWRAVRWQASSKRRRECWESPPPSRCCKVTSLMLSSFFFNHLCLWGFFPCQWHWRLIELLSSASIQREVTLNITLLFIPASDFLLLLMFYSDRGRFSETILAAERRFGSPF